MRLHGWTLVGTFALVGLAAFAWQTSRGIVPQSKRGGDVMIEPLPGTDTAGHQADYEIVLTDMGAPANTDQTPQVESEALDDDATQDLLNRLPKLPQAAEPSEPALPPKSKPAPRPGQRIELSFPPPKIDDPVPMPDYGEPPQVLRVSPEGEVDQASALSVTFSQPMVPLTSHAELAYEDVPVTLEPQIPGSWRWIGTQTLSFEPTQGFPAATRFSATIAVDVASMAGQTLEQAYSWSFETPRPKPTRFHPTGGPQELRPMMAIAFNQPIQADLVVGLLKLEAGGKRYTVRRLPHEEALQNPRIRQQFRHIPEGHWIAFRPMFLLPSGTDVTLTVPKGIVAAEGPLPSRETHQFKFSTYDKLAVKNIECFGHQGCGPGDPWNLHFSNQLDKEKFSEGWIEIEPAIDFEWQIYGHNLNIQPKSQANTTYKIKLAAEIVDIFEQTLQSPTIHQVEVGPAPETFRMYARDFALLDPRTGPALQFDVAGYESVDITVRKVEQSDWKTFLQEKRNRSRDYKPRWPGEILAQERVQPEDAEIRLQQFAFDLEPYFQLGAMLLVQAEPQGGVSNVKQRMGRMPYQHHVVWLQHTPIGAHVLASPNQIRVFVSQFADGAPVANAKVELMTVANGRIIAQATSDANGLVSFDGLPDQQSPLGVRVKRGEDKLFLPENQYHVNHDSMWLRTRPAGGQSTAFIIDDRGIYKPGERVHIKGWLRRSEPSKAAPSIPNDISSIQATVRGPRGNEILSESYQLNSYAAFDFDFDLPKDINLGYAYVEVSWQEAGMKYPQRSGKQIQIAEFRTPEFEVSVDLTAGNLVIGDDLNANLQAQYYSGEPLTSAPVSWNVSSQDTHYAPPNWQQYQFGRSWPWWCRMWFPEPERRVHASIQGQTDATGAAHLAIDFDGEPINVPQQLEVEGSAQDVNVNTIAGKTSAILHPADYYVGVKAKRQFAAVGAELEYSIVVTDIDGNPVSGEVVLFEVSETPDPFETAKSQDREPAFSAQIRVDDGPMSLSFKLDEPGSYQVTAKVRDGKARTMQTTLPLWLGKVSFNRTDRVSRDQLIFIPDRERYEPGETAEIIIQAPFDTAYGVVLIGRHDLESTQSVQWVDGQARIQVKISEQHIPQLTIAAIAHGQQDGKPAFASATHDLAIADDAYRLDISIESNQVAYLPGEAVNLQLETGDANAEVLLMVVDEAVLAFSSYELTNPQEFFLKSPYWPFQQKAAHELLILERPKHPVGAMIQAEAMEESMQVNKSMALRASSQADDSAGGANPIAVRQDFRALAAYYASLRSDSDGRVTATFNLPERLTRYRVMAVSASKDGTRFGTAEANIHTRLPLNIRPNLPRFLNFGDTAQLSFTVHNQTDADRRVNLAVKANGLAFPEGQGRCFDIPANTRVEITLPAKADRTGTLTVQAAISSEDFSDAVQVSLPIYAPATSEAFATYGSFDDASVQQQTLRVPLEAFDQFGGLDITTSATALHGLRDAVDYLRTYPYPFAEPLASRLISYVALQKVLPEFGSEWEPSTIQNQIEADLQALLETQRNDGGFGIWRGAQESNPFVSVHVAHALTMAEQAGFQVSNQMQRNLQGYLDRLEQTMQNLNYGHQTQFTVLAYQLMVEHKRGKHVEKAAARLMAKQDLKQAPLDALAMLMPFLPQEQYQQVWQHARNHLEETASSASFSDDSGFAYRVFRSDRRTDALMLIALLKDAQQADLSSKLARGLLAHREVGRWRTTQENVFVILGLSAYFHAFEQTDPNFTAQYWLADRYVAEHPFQQRQAARQNTQLPMAWLTSFGADTDLIFQKQGPGRMYYRLGLEYAPRSLELEATSHGFAVERSFEAVDNADDVTIEDDGSVRIKRGSRVRVTLRMAANGRRHHVALVDRLPAGLEIIDSSLPTSEQVPNTKRKPAPWWAWRWYSHENLRDAQAEAFSLSVAPGSYTYSYVARAVNAGEYIAPPAKAEEMYAPETFGRSATTRVMIED